MTRINIIHPSHLSDKHLLAEYRELPRTVDLLVRYYYRKLVLNKQVTKIPENYTMGTGHVTFFYNKYYYLANRFDKIVKECINRGFKIQYLELKSIRQAVYCCEKDIAKFYLDILNEQIIWTPDNVDNKVNFIRLLERDGEFYTRLSQSDYLAP
jgi:deoxyribonuclease (pyrimidine dimer)